MSSADPPPFEPFPVERSEQLYDSPWCGLRRDWLRLADGREQEYHVFEVTDAVVVVPFLPDGRVVMIWQYRHPHGRSHWEVPAGRLHAGEDPAVAAVRELREETGYAPGRVEALPGFFPINGISAHYAHAFVAHDCELAGEPEPEDSERIAVRVLGRDEVERRLHAGGIADGFTALALLYAFGAAKR